MRVSASDGGATALRCGSGMALGVWQRSLIPSWKGTTSNSHGVVFVCLFDLLLIL